MESQTYSFCVLSIAVLVVALGGSVTADVVINELHYEPIEKTIAEEFIELHNTGSVSVDLSGWFFSSGLTFTFPEGTVIEPDGFLVVAEDPAVLAETLGYRDALGPFEEGRLANEGERLVLRTRDGQLADEVDYAARFPWPFASAGRGSSMELVHPSLDNNLGSSWRASGLIDRPFLERQFFLDREAEGWRYRKGTSEASDPPSAWRQPEFEEDLTWLPGQTPIGFGNDFNTELFDMRRVYNSVYVRRTFQVDTGEIPEALMLGLFADDGAVVWINGVEVMRLRVPDGELAFDAEGETGREDWVHEFLPDPRNYLRLGENTLAIHAFNVRLTSNDFSIDAELFVPGTEDYDSDFLDFPSPGETNTVLADNAPPNIRQVEHTPLQPRAGEEAVVTAKVTDPDGVASVTLHYQVVEPGRFIPAFLPFPHNELLALAADPERKHEPNPEFEDPANWTALSMRDDGREGDATAGDDIYSVRLPAQAHRTLVRYRITVTDSRGASVRVPYGDDTSLNFALFVYDGVPAYVASDTSVHEEGPGHVYSEEVMSSLPTYHVLTRAEDMDQCVNFQGRFTIPKSNEAGRDEFNWECAFVYEGRVYDHVTYRLRQANDRYGGSSKRSFRFRFRKGNHLQVRDSYGKRYPTEWRTLNTGKMFDNKGVINFGLTETINAILWNMVDVPAPFAHTFHMRVIDDVEEVPAENGQYLGDFWGMHLAFEDYDTRFLDAHDLEDGNLYKLKDGIFNGNLFKRHQGRNAVTDDSDFQNIRMRLRPQQDAEWLRAHVNYERWYPYHTVVEAVRHYDFVPADSHSKNRAWYFEPDYEASPFGRLWTLPWDSDASWGPNWNSGIDYSKNAIGGKAEFQQEYRNVIREFRDLLWTEETILQMIDDLAAIVDAFHEADRDRWERGPPAAGRQTFGPMDRKVEDMKRFAFEGWTGGSGPTVPAGGRARHLDNLADAGGDRNALPETPVVTSTSPAGFPVDRLSFAVTPFSDPDEDVFAALEWRAGEVEPGAEFRRDASRVYEWNAVWESGELTTFEPETSIPAAALLPGHTYRVRARYRNAAGRWSHWSEPVEFSAGIGGGGHAYVGALRVTELMFHPLGDEDFEFLELRNVGAEPIDLREVSFADGIEFSFATSAVTTLAPGAYVVVVRNAAAFAARYSEIGAPIAGEYSGQLNNAGERIEIVVGAAALPILALEYDDAWHRGTDGDGYSLVMADELGPIERWNEPESWRPSFAVHGSPGAGDTELTAGGQLAGDFNQDRRVNLTDAVGLFRFLLGVSPGPLPCASGSLEDAANRALLDLNADDAVDISDGLYLLVYVHAGGPPPTGGVDCVAIAECPDRCAEGVAP